MTGYRTSQNPSQAASSGLSPATSLCIACAASHRSTARCTFHARTPESCRTAGPNAAPSPGSHCAAHAAIHWSTGVRRRAARASVRQSRGHSLAENLPAQHLTRMGGPHIILIVFGIVMGIIIRHLVDLRETPTQTYPAQQRRPSMPQKTIVHMIGQAHLDPVWLWRWTKGHAEALATSQSAVDRLAEYPGTPLHARRSADLCLDRGGESRTLYTHPDVDRRRALARWVLC